jgi:hypothetical protein
MNIIKVNFLGVICWEKCTYWGKYESLEQAAGVPLLET